MAVFDAYFGRVFNDGTELELAGGFDFKSGLQAVLNTVTKRIEISLAPVEEPEPEPAADDAVAFDITAADAGPVELAVEVTLPASPSNGDSVYFGFDGTVAIVGQNSLLSCAQLTGLFTFVWLDGTGWVFYRLKEPPLQVSDPWSTAGYDIDAGAAGQTRETIPIEFESTAHGSYGDIRFVGYYRVWEAAQP